MKKLILTGCLVLFSLGFALGNGTEIQGAETQASATKGVQSLLTFPWPDTTCRGCGD